MAINKVKNEGALTKATRSIINHNFADVSLATTQFDAVTGTTGTTLTNVVGMVTEALETGTYRFKIHLAGVSTANSGVKVGLKFGTASMLTSISCTATGSTASASATQRVTTATDAASLFAQTAAVIKVELEGILVVAVAGTLQLQAAQNAAHADTTSVYVDSYMTFTKVATN